MQSSYVYLLCPSNIWKIVYYSVYFNNHNNNKHDKEIAHFKPRHVFGIYRSLDDDTEVHEVAEVEHEEVVLLSIVVVEPVKQYVIMIAGIGNMDDLYAKRKAIMVAWNWENRTSLSIGEFKLADCLKCKGSELRGDTIVNHWGWRRAKNSVRTMHITPNIKDSLSMNFTCNEQCE